jgi:hypothetical protein
MPVRVDDLVTALTFGTDGDGHQAFLRKSTGEVLLHSEFGDPIDELPDDVEENEDYIRLPGKRELDLGKPLVLDFVGQFLPGDFDEVKYIFSKRGAYAKFKALLIRRGALDRWHDFENKAEERAMREWCELNGIEVAD